MLFAISLLRMSSSLICLGRFYLSFKNSTQASSSVLASKYQQTSKTVYSKYAQFSVYTLSSIKLLRTY